MRVIQTTAAKTLRVFLTILCVILAIAFTFNIILILKAEHNKAKPPSLFGYTPLVVLSGSMTGEQADSFCTNDLVLIQSVDTNSLSKNDVIAFYEGNTIITHRIVAMETDEAGETVFVTKGDANNIEDVNRVTRSAVLGKFASKFAGIGSIVSFLQTPVGMILTIGLPMLLFCICEILAERKAAREKARENQALSAELALLKTQK